MSELCRLRRSEGYGASDDDKQEKALTLSERQGRDFCPQCGQLRGRKLTLFWRTGKLIDAGTCENP